MAEGEETRNYVHLTLRDGERVHLRSIWQTASFSIDVFDGFRAWSHTVSTKEVVSIANQWFVDVGEFMRSARARLSRQHPTSLYDLSAQRDSDFAHLSFAMDGLCDGESLDFQLRLNAVSDMRPVVWGMLNNLADSNDKVKEQLKESQNRLRESFRQFAATTDREAGISLSLTRSGANNNLPRRPSSVGLPEIRRLDYSSLNVLEDRAALTRPESSRSHAEQCLLDSTSKMASPMQPLPSIHLPDSDREDSCFQSLSAAPGGNVSVNTVNISPKLLKVLNSISDSMDRSHGVCREENLGLAAGDERGLKITEMTSPRRDEETPRRSSRLLDTQCACPTVSSQEAVRQKVSPREKSPAEEARESSVQPGKQCGSSEDRAYTTGASVMWNSTSAAMKSTQENPKDGDFVVPEKGTLNVGEQWKIDHARVVAPADEGRAYVSSTGRVNFANAFRSGSAATLSNLRVKSILPQPLPPPIQQANEAKHKKRQDLQNTASAGTERVYRPSSRRQDSPVETPRNQSPLSRGGHHTLDAVGATPSSRKRQPVTESYTEEEVDEDSEDSDDDDDDDYTGQEENQETRAYALHESTRSRAHGVMTRVSRKRHLGDGEENPGLRSAKLEDGDVGADLSAEFLDDSPSPVTWKKKKPDEEARCTIAEMLSLKLGNCKNSKGRAGASPSEKKPRRGGHDDGALREDGVDTTVPKPDLYNFDGDRTEALVEPGQVWAMYDPLDGMPRVYARIDKVVRFPRFEAVISWLQPHQPCEEARRWKEVSRLFPSCGEFECGGKEALSEINCFSHRMEVAAVSPRVVHIFPREGEIWALFRKTEKQDPTASSSRSASSRFRLVEILEDVAGRGRKPKIFVLGRVPGYHTVWKPEYERGTLPDRDLSRFSHRVPAHPVKGLVVDGKVLRGAWDVDPAGLLPCDSQGDV